MRLLATFTPQAWQNDYAIDVDPNGPTVWDCTEFIRDAANGLKENDILEGIQNDGSWLDTDDVLKGDDAAPEWVREWQGPFSINVERVDGEEPLTQAQRERVSLALGHLPSDMEISDAYDRANMKDVEAASVLLAEKLRAFESAGGRGVEMAEEIDALRVFIAVTGTVADEYEDGECPDCGETIPLSAVKGGECANCGHVWN